MLCPIPSERSPSLGEPAGGFRTRQESHPDPGSAVRALLSCMPHHTSLEELAATGLVEIDQDMEGVTLTMQRLDGVWATQLLRPILGVLFSLLTLGGLGILYAGLDMLSNGHLSGLWIVPLSLAWTVASAALVADWPCRGSDTACSGIASTSLSMR